MQAVSLEPYQESKGTTNPTSTHNSQEEVLLENQIFQHQCSQLDLVEASALIPVGAFNNTVHNKNNNLTHLGHLELEHVAVLSSHGQSRACGVTNGTLVMSVSCRLFGGK